jgi:sugar phosphate isomerase/epimerase
MNAKIRIGFSMHPNWLAAGSLGDFLAPLRAAGLAALEFELDDHLSAWPAFPALMEQAVQAGMALSFHAPYRAPHSLAGFAGERRGAIQAGLAPLLAVAENWAQRSPACQTVVVHAAVGSQGTDPSALREDTIGFIEWACAAFPDLRLALENTPPAAPGQVKVGTSKEEVLDLIRAANQPQLGACWDMGHDMLLPPPDEPSPEWLARVIHVHVHDIDSNGADHHPLIFGVVPFQRWLAAWKAAGGQGLAVLELKGQHLQGWGSQRISRALASSIAQLAEVVQ